jgi:hypothetical protein
MTSEEKVALGRLEQANNWLSTQAEKVGSEFSGEIDKILNDLTTASRALNVDERDAVENRLAGFQRDAQALDTKLSTDIGRLLIAWTPIALRRRMSSNVGPIRSEILIYPKFKEPPMSIAASWTKRRL